MKDEGQKSLKNVMIQYRLRADLVPHLAKLIEARKEAEMKQLHQELVIDHGNALGVDLPLEKLDAKQMNRLASYQAQLSTTLVIAMKAMSADKTISQSAEYLSLKEQLVRAETRVAGARQDYLAKAPIFNVKLSTVPEKWFNAFLYKLESLPDLQ